MNINLHHVPWKASGDRSIRAWLALLLALLWVQTARADQPLEIIPLRHQTVERMLPLLRPFVEPGGTVTGMNGQLVIRTSPGNLEQLRRIIENFDQAPRQLRIAVRQASASHSRSTAIGVAGSMEGKEGSLAVGRPSSGLQLQAEKNRRRYSTDEIHYLRTTEGTPAYIASGYSMPLVTGVPGPWGWPGLQTNYQDITSGFQVTPWIQGEQVTLEIRPFGAKPVGNGQVFQVQELDTRITGNLGEWIPLGGAETNRQVRGQSLTSHATSASQARRPIEVKVEMLHQ